jgi:hypothetical protein
VLIPSDRKLTISVAWLAVSAVILATGHRILKRSGDSMEDNEIETMALTDDVEEEQGWSPGDAPGPKVSKMRKKGARLGIV